jgi:3-hydroxyacyl-CoA dehydrogenase
MASSIKTVGVVGTGVIGASWTALFLANGLRVLVSDPAPGAKDRLATYLSGVWPALERLHLHHDASISNWTFVGETLDDACAEVDFIQEVNDSHDLEILGMCIADGFSECSREA